MYALVVVRGEGGAGAEEDRDEALAVDNCVVQGRTSLGGPRVDRGARGRHGRPRGGSISDQDPPLYRLQGLRVV